MRDSSSTAIWERISQVGGKCLRYRFIVVVMCVIAALFMNMKILPDSTEETAAAVVDRNSNTTSGTGTKNYYLAPFVTDFLHHNKTKEGETTTTVCEEQTSMLIFKEWKASRERFKCTHNDDQFLVDRYVLDRWEHKPTIVRYRNVLATSKCGPPSIDINKKDTCTMIQKEDRSKEVVKSGNGNETLVDATVIRVSLFDPYNAYERFHAYINVAMMMTMFDIRDPQLVFVGSQRKMDDHDQQMWSYFSSLPPIFLVDDTSDSSVNYRFREVLDAFSSGMSMLTINNQKEGGLRGRGTDHHCESTLFQAIIAWLQYKSRLQPPSNNSNNNHRTTPLYTTITRPTDSKTKTTTTTTTDTTEPSYEKKIQIVWSSRQVYCCREGKEWFPKRVVKDETKFLESLLDTLGNDNYSIIKVDFGPLTPSESIQVVSSSNIMMGVHGAGLIWSAFLPHNNDSNGGVSSGLVEIFGGDRGSGNRHYHNLASLLGIPYRQANHWPGGAQQITWSDSQVTEAAKLIRSLDPKKA